MTAMLSLVWVFILVVMMMLRDADSVQIIQVSKTSGESVVLEPSLLRGRMGTRGDFRWTHLHLLLNNKTTKCHHGRCELLRNGSLSFSQLQLQDSGNYTLEVYDEAGVMKEKKIFLLQVKDSSSTSSSSSSRVRTSSLICCMVLLLLLLFIAFFILRKRRLQRELSSGLKEDNVYSVMHGYHGSKENREEQGEKEEESLYVPCYPVTPAEQPEDVYV